MTAIEFDHVGKQYRLGLVSTGTLAHDLNRFWQTTARRREARRRPSIDPEILVLDEPLAVVGEYS